MPDIEHYNPTAFARWQVDEPEPDLGDLPGSITAGGPNPEDD